MKKKRGRYAEGITKVHAKAKGKTFKLTLFLPEEVARKLLPQLRRFVAASKKRKD